MSDVQVEGGDTSSQGPVCIWQGMDFPTWVRFLALGPPIDIWHSGRIILTTLLTLNNSILGLVERFLYERQIQAHQVKSPVFILGHWRSGTTLLHNVLAFDPQFTTTTLYRVLAFHHFVLTEKTVTWLTAPFLPKSRPMDNMEISWDAPQEDESIICNLSLLSPYLMTAFHSDDSVYGRFFDLKHASAQERRRWQQTILYVFKKISFRNDKRPLLKSPTHTYRVKALLEVFPDAKFIHIVRNPYAVFPSAIHMRKRIFSENGLRYPDFGMIEEDFFKSYNAMFRALDEDRRLLQDNQFFEIRFEDFEQNMVGELRKLYEHLQMPGWTQLEAALQPRLDQLQAYKKNKFSKLNETIKRKIYEGCRYNFERYGYDSELAPPLVGGPLPQS